MIGFVIENVAIDDEAYTFELTGYKEELQYTVELELQRPLTPDSFVFQGEVMTLRRVDDRSDALLEALAREVDCQAAPMAKTIEIENLFTLNGDAASLEDEAVEFKGFLDNGKTEFYITFDLPEKAIVLHPRKGQGPRLIAALSAGHTG